jgi:predicted deacylase
MENSIKTWDIHISRRIDGSPWPLRFYEVSGSRPGPTTAFLSGMLGDKPLGVVAMHRLIAQLRRLELIGSVLIIPAFNLPALEAGQRFNADHRMINRTFPGAPTGFLPDQFAYHLLRELNGRCDALIDVHSGTASISLKYIYDYGDVEFSAAWGGDFPVILNFSQPGQLCSLAAQQGIKSCLVEFGGGSFDDPSEGVRGCLNVLRHRGQLDDIAPTPKASRLIRDMQIFLPSTSGILCGRYSAKDVGQLVEPGIIGQVVDALTGDVHEEFAVTREGGVLLVGVTMPAIASPGSFAHIVGFPMTTA